MAKDAERKTMYLLFAICPNCPIRSKKLKENKDNKMMIFGVDKLRHTIRRTVSMLYKNAVEAV